jgi:hypothetical protein
VAGRFDHLLPVYTPKELAAERWKVASVNGVKYYNYGVSDLGRVRNLTTGQYLKLLWCHAVRGEASVYWRVCMSRGPRGQRERKAFLVHRLVAELYVPGRTPFKNIVNHLDRVTYNPRYNNLEWTDNSGNMKWHYIGKKEAEAEAEYYANLDPFTGDDPIPPDTLDAPYEDDAPF